MAEKISIGRAAWKRPPGWAMLCRRLGVGRKNHKKFSKKTNKKFECVLRRVRMGPNSSANEAWKNVFSFGERLANSSGLRRNLFFARELALVEETAQLSRAPTSRARAVKNPKSPSSAMARSVALTPHRKHEALHDARGFECARLPGCCCIARSRSRDFVAARPQANSENAKVNCRPARAGNEKLQTRARKKLGAGLIERSKALAVGVRRPRYDHAYAGPTRTRTRQPSGSKRPSSACLKGACHSSS